MQWFVSIFEEFFLSGMSKNGASSIYSQWCQIKTILWMNTKSTCWIFLVSRFLTEIGDFAWEDFLYEYLLLGMVHREKPIQGIAVYFCVYMRWFSFLSRFHRCVRKHWTTKVCFKTVLIFLITSITKNFFTTLPDHKRIKVRTVNGDEKRGKRKIEWGKLMWKKVRDINKLKQTNVKQNECDKTNEKQEKRN